MFINAILLVSFLDLIPTFFVTHGANTFPNCIEETAPQFLCIRVLNGTNMRYVVGNDTLVVADSYVEILTGSGNSNESIIKTTQSDQARYPDYYDGICITNDYDTITFRVWDYINSTYSIEIGSITYENLDNFVSSDVSYFDDSLTVNDDILLYLGQVPSIMTGMWATSEQCINLTHGEFRVAGSYQINLTFVDMVWNTQSEAWQMTSQQTYFTEWSDNTADPIWNELYCSITNRFIADIEITRESAPDDTITVTSPLQYTTFGNRSVVNGTYTLQTAFKYTMDNWTFSFELSDNNGDMFALWIETCDDGSGGGDSDGDSDGGITLNEIDGIIATSALAFSIFILSLGVIAIIFSCWRSMTTYPASDPVNYLAVGWLVLELWDFFSDIAFTILLYFVWVEDGELYFFFGAAFLGIPYICNLYYMIHLLQIWNHPKAPGQTRHWLELWSWYFIVIAMISGGVHPALEITNSVLLPNELFGMHLPYSEVVRVRSERFVTNVLCENIPHLILQVTYILAEDTRVKADNYTLTATFISTAFSLFFSGIYYCIHSRQAKESIATHAFSFTFSAQECLPYMTHSHWRIQTAVQKGFQLHSPSQVILDQCIELSQGMKVEGRLMGDATAVNRRISVAIQDLKPNKFSTASSSERSTAYTPRGGTTQSGTDPMSDEKFLGKIHLKEIEIKSYLVKEFKFQRANADTTCNLSGLLVRVINGGHGEVLYHHDTSAKIFCKRVGRCTHLCCYGLCHRCCPGNVCRKPVRTATDASIHDVNSASPPPPPASVGLSAIQETPGNGNDTGLVDSGEPKPFSTWQTYDTNYGESGGRPGIHPIESASASIRSTPVVGLGSPTTPSFGIPKTNAESANEGKKSAKLGVSVLFADVVKEENRKKYNESHVVHAPNTMTKPTKMSDADIAGGGLYESGQISNKYSNNYGNGYDNDAINDAFENDNLKRLNSEKQIGEPGMKWNKKKRETIEDKYENLLKARRQLDDDDDGTDAADIPKSGGPPPVPPGIITQSTGSNVSSVKNVWESKAPADKPKRKRPPPPPKKNLW